uniref:Regulatory protein E2 n=1 Tax=Human papillomavirus TaxID=10566 RepID=A0A386H6W7_9PAPI|nr:MAG: E2 protein [Human papillomavirus]
MARRGETQESLTERFDALQEAIMTIYEEGATDLASQIQYWDLIRKENITLYYARKCGFNKLGLQPTPALAVSEYNAKAAIKTQMLLKSLAKSEFANDPWTWPETSAELLNTEPKDRFKKKGYTVEVWYDNDRDKAFPYTNWREIYYQDEQDKWHKAEGKVDINGLYYIDNHGDIVYFTLFGPDADKYGVTGEWTVLYNNTRLVSSSSSAKRAAGESTKRKRDESTTGDSPSTSQEFSGRIQRETVSSTSETDLRSGRGERELPTSSKRRRVQPTELLSSPTPAEVGTRHRSTQRTGLSRLHRLQIEARDPPVLIIKGPANPLKCWRNRITKTNSVLFQCCSTVWRWIGDNNTLGSRMLIAFDSIQQRNKFLQLIKPPKHAEFALGSLDSL